MYQSRIHLPTFFNRNFFFWFCRNFHQIVFTALNKNVIGIYILLYSTIYIIKIVKNTFVAFILSFTFLSIQWKNVFLYIILCIKLIV